jgi:hypothetical protein
VAKGTDHVYDSKSRGTRALQCQVSGYMVSLNTIYWSAYNLTLTHGIPVYDVKVGVWCVMGATRIVLYVFMRPYFHSDMLHTF